MGFNRSALALAGLAAALAGCAAPAEEYPSLAIRDAERVTGTLEPAAPEPYVPPPPPAGVVDRLDGLVAEAVSAHQEFVAEAPAVRTAVAAARGTEEGEDAWARAQVAIAGLQASRSRAMIALADIDRLYVDAALEGTALDRLTAAREQVAGQVEQEDAVVEELLAGLR